MVSAGVVCMFVYSHLCLWKNVIFFSVLLQELSCLQVRSVCPDILDACSATYEREDFMKSRNIHTSKVSAPIQVAKFENLPSRCNFSDFYLHCKHLNILTDLKYIKIA